MIWTRRFLFVLLLLSGGVALSGQSSGELNEGSRLVTGADLGSFQYSWWGRPGVTYFLQSSENLIDWEFFRLIEPGDGEIAAWGFVTTADGLFLRLNYVEEVNADPWNTDHDNDLITSYDELLLGTNPLELTGPLELSADDDEDLVPNAEDALPSDPTVGQLSIAIDFPTQGGTVQ